MSTLDARSEPPLPPRIRWFAPWTWKRRNLAIALLAAFLIGYPLSIGPALRLAKMGVAEVKMVAWIYRPVLFCAWRCGPGVRGGAIDYMRSWDRDLGNAVFVLHWIWEVGAPPAAPNFAPVPPSSPPNPAPLETHGAAPRTTDN
jgi:hypothetical protein